MIVSSGHKPILSVIIVNWNTKQLLEQCVLSVLNSSDMPTYETLVVDNHSDDGSPELMRTNYPKMRLLSGDRNLGFSKAVNWAIRESCGDYILLAHPDVKFDKTAIAAMIDWLRKEPKRGVVGANLMYPSGDWQRRALAKRSLRRDIFEFGFPLNKLDAMFSSFCSLLGMRLKPLYWDHCKPVEVDAVWNACMMFKREMLDEVGLFDEDYFVWFADTDWCYRAKDAEWSIAYIPNAIVVHYEVQSGLWLEDNDKMRYKTDFLPSELMQHDMRTLFKKRFGLIYRTIAWTLRRLCILKSRLARCIGKR
jgi:GT2 family glycosyltransferase